jgi:ribulose-5-phosphate 4-epimerase/fuculose-1-phosphate aldolase
MNKPEKPAKANSEYLLRMQVAACTMLLVDQKIMNYSGHVSARLPDRPDNFLIQPIDVPRSGLRPNHLLICDYDGNVLEGPAGEKPPAEVSLHGEILRSRKDVNAVAHFHHDRTNSFTLVEDVPLRIVKNHAVRWKSGIPVHPDPAHVANAELGQAVVRTLGDHHALQIRAHGQVITAESVEAVLNDSVHFVENAEAMYAACAIGRVKPLSEEDMASFEKWFKRGRHVNKLWRFYVEGAQTGGVIPADWAI